MSQQDQQVFNGRYELHRKIARGGMADVYLARDSLLDRPVALKVLFPEFAADPTFVQRFRGEAQAAANLSHPNIVSVYDWGEENGTYFIVMEHIDGRSVAQIISDEGPLLPDRAADVAADIAAALGFAHRNGVIHRDVKPGNVLISPSGQVKVTDFGIARAVTTQENLTQTGTVMGTATYFSPEQAQGHQVDPRSDVYSLGVVLYEMLAGHPPFKGDSAVAVAYKHVQERPEPLRAANPAVPAPLEAVTLKALAKNPANRYDSAEDLRADLRRFREGSPVLAESIMAAPVAQDVTQAQAATRVESAYDDGTRVQRTVTPYEEPRRRNGAFIALMVGLLVLLAGLLALAANSLGVFDGDDTPQVDVPQVVGRTQEDAVAILRDANLVAVPVAEENDTVPEGLVIRQDPEDGSRVDEDSEVEIFVSSGLPPVEVPSLVGQNVTDAQAALAAAGLRAGIREEPSDSVAAGEVMEQNPEAGEEVPADSVVELVVSSGPADVAVPDVVNQTESSASNALGRADFQVEPRSEASDTVAAGRVIRTDPVAGTELTKGSTVTLFVSSGPANGTVPDVKNLSEEEASAQIEAAGFRVSTSSAATDDPAEDGVVILQNPAGGQQRPLDSTVEITIGVFEGDE